MQPSPSQRHSILLAEDEVIVAMDLSMQLEDAGYRCLGPVETVEDALALLEEETPDFAILDANLGGTHPVAVAEKLAATGVPFVYMTGYSVDFITRHLPEAPVIEKPIRAKDVLDFLAQHLQQERA